MQDTIYVMAERNCLIQLYFIFSKVLVAVRDQLRSLAIDVADSLSRLLDKLLANSNELAEGSFRLKDAEGKTTLLEYVIYMRSCGSGLWGGILKNSVHWFCLVILPGARQYWIAVSLV